MQWIDAFNWSASYWIGFMGNQSSAAVPIINDQKAEMIGGGHLWWNNEEDLGMAPGGCCWNYYSGAHLYMSSHKNSWEDRIPVDLINTGMS